MSEKWTDYAVEYKFEGKAWALTIRARSLKEAEERLWAIGAWGVVVGSDVEEVAAFPGAGLIVRMTVWWRNFWRRRGDELDPMA